MEEKQHTYGEFIDLMEKLAKEIENVDAQIAIEDWKALATEEQWKGFRPLPIEPGLVIKSRYLKLGTEGCLSKVDF